MRRAALATLLATSLLGACSRSPEPPTGRRKGSSPSRAVLRSGDEPHRVTGPGAPVVAPATAPADRQAQCRALRQRILTEATAALAPLGRGLDARTIQAAYDLDHEPAACPTLPDEALDCLLRAAHPLTPSRRCGVDDRLRLGVPRTIRRRLAAGPADLRIATLTGRWVRLTSSAARPERVIVGAGGEVTWETEAEEPADATSLTGTLQTGDDGEVWLDTPTRPVPVALLRLAGGALLLSDNPLLRPWPIPAGAPVLAPLGRDTVAVLAEDQRCAVIDLAYLMRLPATCTRTPAEGDGHPVITVTWRYVDTPFSTTFHLLAGHVVPEALLHRRFTRLSAGDGPP